jgi:hypothetical protein
MAEAAKCEQGSGAAAVLWDPLNAWPAARPWLWASLAVLVCWVWGPLFVQISRPPRDLVVDFFQDWASGRNYFSGSPIYADLKGAVERYLGVKVRDKGEPGVRVDIAVNAHPPTSVLLTLPLALLPYPDAALVWNLVSLVALFASLWIVRRELAIPVSAWSVFPLVTLLLLSPPFQKQVIHGQFNLILLLLLTGSWAAQRNNRPGWAGVLLGTAAAIKLFPGFLFCYFLLRRQWKAVMSGIISLAVLTALTVAVLGVQTYKSYRKDVLPQVAVFRSAWLNTSLPGLWIKLFDPSTAQQRVNPDIERIEPLWRSPALAELGAWLSCGVVVAVLARLVWRARSRAEKDQAFGLTVIAMLLVSPITWNHYLLLLLIPLAVTWVRLPPSNLARTLFLIVLLAVWMEPMRLFNAFIPGGYWHGTAYPIHVIGVLSFHCYALVILFALSAALSRPQTIAAHLPAARSSPSPDTDTAKRFLSLETVYDKTPCPS